MKNDWLCYLASAALIAGWALTPTKTHAQRNHHLSVSVNENAEHCSDLRVRSDGQFAQVNDTYNLTKGEAPILEMSGMDRSVINVRGWEQGEYTVEACKVAVAEDPAAAQQTVRAISVTRRAGQFSLSGPSNDDVNWQVYFIVHAPKDANLNLETRNGPIAVSGINGNVKLRAVNGPIAVSDTAGTVDVHTTNGPIAFSGNGGEVHLNATNGPIALNLKGDFWNGTQLEAHTINGPVSLNVPDTFRSGVRLETSGHSPVSCQASACKAAWTDLTSNQRVIQLNGSDTIRVSTNNGPVSIGGTKDHKIM